MAELLTVSSVLALVAVSTLEIVLGIDNLVFIAILCERLPEQKRAMARKLGLALAAIGRIVLLLAAAWVIMLDERTLIHVGEWDLTAHDLVLIAGGLFLIGKATWEIHSAMEGHGHGGGKPGKAAGMAGIITQVLLLDLVFSIDSVLTAVGLVEPEKYTAAAIPFTGVAWTAFTLMSIAILLAVAVMLFFVEPVSRFITRHPTVKMLALAFLLLIGVVLTAEGLGQHVPRGYIYTAMGFSVFVELLNLKVRGQGKGAVETTTPTAE
jgi:predicted tellurium resistance membrane protein TerC